MIGFDVNLLTAYYQAKNGVARAAGATSTLTGSKPRTAAPTAPWSTESKAPRADDLVKSVLNGSKFVNEGAVKVDVPNTNPEYKKLFALYQGLNALEGLAEHIQEKGKGDTEKARYRAVFDRGMAEISKYLDDGPFEDFGVALGAVAARVQTTVGTQRAPDGYQTIALHKGTMSEPVAAFAGNVAFSMSVAKVNSSQVVNFDLAEMGSTPRTMSNVVLYLNDKLSLAGATTRFSNVRIPGAPITTTAGGKTLTLGTAPDSFALKVKTDTSENVSFQAAATAPAVYVGGMSGLPAPPVTTTTPPAKNPDGTPKTPVAPKATLVEELYKFEVGGAGLSGAGVDGKTSTRTLGAEVTAIKSSVTAADGSLYVLADINGGTNGEKIKGATDVALIKYDSAGNQLFSRSLGAAIDAQGFALTLSADGTRIAVGGQVTGALDAGDVGANGAVSDSFVSVFDSKGESIWTQRTGAKADDKVTALAFAADGSLYATGVTSGPLNGQVSLGGLTDSYLRGFSASGVTKFSTTLGSAGSDRTSGIVVDGSSVVIAGVETGQATLRRYDLQPTGAPVLASQRSLGALGGGDLAGLALGAGGTLILAGTTTANLSAGTPTNSYDGLAKAGFVASISADLSASGADRLTYLDDATDKTVSAFTLSGGQVYVTGQLAITPPPGQKSAHDGYVAAVDPLTGTISWSTALKGVDRESKPTTIAVAQTGASVLDRLGLPTGLLNQPPSKTLVANSSVRVGDQFVINGDAGAKTVTIEAADTLQTLATKISRASNFTLKVQVMNVDGRDQLKLSPAYARAEVSIEGGRKGRDALKALGLAEGTVTNDPTDTRTALRTKTEATFGLGLSTAINLSTEASSKQAATALLSAANLVRQIFNDLVKPPTIASTKPMGTVPAYLTAQIANYQLALARLGG